MRSLYSLMFIVLLSCTDDSNKTEHDQAPDIDISEPFIEWIKFEESKRYQGQINDGNFYIIDHELNSEITGNVWPQVISNGTTHYAFDFHEFPDSSFVKGQFELVSGAKLTDCLSDDVSGIGLLISSKAKSVFEEFNLGTHKFHPCDLKDQEGKSHEYYYLQFLDDLNPNQLINFEESRFIDIYRDSVNGQMIDTIQFDSYENYAEYKETKYRLFMDNSAPFHDVDIKQLVLENTDSTLAVYLFPKMHSEIFVTKELVDAIEKAKLTGFSITSTSRLLKN